jgi:hypothetical protein
MPRPPYWNRRSFLTLAGTAFAGIAAEPWLHAASTAIGFGKPGDPVFNAVHDIALGQDGSIYVAETRTKRVVKLRPIAS